MAVANTQGHTRLDVCTGVATAFTLVSILIVGLRTFARTRVIRIFGKDDVFIIAALVFTIAYLVLLWVMRQNGMGESGKVLELQQMQFLIQSTLAIEIIYYLLISCIKMSICFCYLRIAGNKTLARLCKGTIWFLVTFCIICVLVCLLQCIPLRQMWNFTGTPLGKCINATALFYSTSVINIITDCWIIALPVRALLQIRRPHREKVGLLFVFGLGIFATTASIVRLQSIRTYTESADPFYDSVPINTWSMVEVNIGIWCASIPALKILVIRHRTPNGTPAYTTHGYNYHSGGRSGENSSTSKSGTEASDGHQALDNFRWFDMGSAAVNVACPEQAAAAGHSETDLASRTADDMCFTAFNPTPRLPAPAAAAARNSIEWFNYSRFGFSGKRMSNAS